MAMKTVSAIGSSGWSCASRDKGQLNKCYTLLSKFPFAALPMYSTMAWGWTVDRSSDISCTGRLELIEPLQSSSARMSSRLWWSSTLRGHWLRISACNENLWELNCRIRGRLPQPINKWLISHCDRSSSSPVYLAASIRTTYRQGFWSVTRGAEREANLRPWVEAGEWSARMLAPPQSTSVFTCQSDCPDKDVAMAWIRWCGF